MSGKQKGGKSISSLPPIEGRHYLFKRGGRSGSISRTISLRLSLCTRDRGCFPEFRRLSLFSERFAFGAHARHRSSLQFAILLAIPPVANQHENNEGRRRTSGKRILDLEFHDTSLFSSSLSHYFSSFENRSSLNYSQLNGRFVFILKISIKS